MATHVHHMERFGMELSLFVDFRVTHQPTPDTFDEPGDPGEIDIREIRGVNSGVLLYGRTKQGAPVDNLTDDEMQTIHDEIFEDASYFEPDED